MITIILPCWIVNDELYDLTVATFQSLAESSGIDKTRIITIDNGSSIGGDMLQKYSDICIRNRENIGYPAAVNQGIKLAKTPLLAILNNDIKVSPNWIKTTEEVFSKLDNIGSLHFKMVGYYEPFNLGEDVWDKGKERWCTGSFFIWNKKAIDEIGGIDENYGLGGYDDWGWHQEMNHIRNWKSAYTNVAAYQHKDSATQNLRDPSERSESDKKNKEYFKSKYGKYPEEIWQEKYPEQMNKPWKPFI